MADDGSSGARDDGRSFWSGLRTFLFGNDSEATLRDQIEEAIESREGEIPKVGDLTPVERRDFISWIDSDKQPETHRRRIEKACSMLAAGKRRP